MIKVGTKIHINYMWGEPAYKGREGVVEYIDSMFQIHGTWGGLAINPYKDSYEVIEE